MAIQGLKLKYITLITLVFLGCCFTICASYPGFMSPDSIDQYNQAKTNQYTDWHPPIMAWIWNKLLWIKDGPQPILFLTNIMYWLSVFLIASKMKRLGLSLVYIFLSFSPPLINCIGVIWKDTLLFATLYFQCSLLYYFHDVKLNRIKTIMLFFSTVFLLYIAVATRHNAAAAVAPLMSLPFFIIFKKNKTPVFIFTGLVLTIIFFTINNKVNSHLCKQKSSHPQQQLMFYDLLALSHTKNVLILPDYLKKKISLDTLRYIYSPCDGAMSVFFGLDCIAKNEQQFDSLKLLWETEIIRNPSAFIRHKYQSFYCLQTNSGLKTFAMIMPNDKGITLNEKNMIRQYFIKITENKYADKLYSGWIYMFGCSVIFVISLIHYRKVPNKQIQLVLFISLSGLLYSLAYFILSPCNDFRYHYWTIAAMFISFVLYTDLLTARKYRK
jgi:hypothetical protein